MKKRVLALLLTALMVVSLVPIQAFATGGTEPSHDKVQLWDGGPYFATTNLGAENPQDFGDYFWWGDTVGYKYDDQNQKWVASNNPEASITFDYSDSTANQTYGKYAWELSTGLDEDNNLMATYDAATVRLGEGWRMPTKAEIDTLANKNYCTATWTSNYNNTGVAGMIITGATAGYTDKSIFLPAAGYGNGSNNFDTTVCGWYWSSTIKDTSPNSETNSNAIFFEQGRFEATTTSRYLGFAIRAVYDVGSSDDTHTHEGYTAWATSTNLPTEPGNYYLTTDVAISSTWNVTPGATNLCLNGHVIKAQTSSTFSAITIGEGATLNLYDCGKTEHYFAYSSAGAWTWNGDLPSEGAITIDKITNSTEDNQLIIVTGGCITGGNGRYQNVNYGTYGGGVYVSGGAFTMYGGNIVGNSAAAVSNNDGHGGGVYVKAGEFSISGGSTILGNKSDKMGAGVYLENGTLHMSGQSQIINNNASTGGGGVYVNNGVFTMTGGKLNSNTASGGNGGGVYVNNGVFTMTAGEINGNTTSAAGGGVSISTNGEFSMSENSRIAYNKAKNGGGVFVNNTFITTGGSIGYNTADEHGGGVFVASNNVSIGGTVKIENNVKGGTITKNNDGTYKLSGDTAENLFLNNKTITLATGTNIPSSGMSVCVTTNTLPTVGTPTRITTNGGVEEGYAQYFTSDKTGYKVQYNNAGYLELALSHVHKVGEETIEFVPCGGGTSHNSMPTTSGNYYLTDDITLTSTWNVPAGTAAEPAITNLCLNGHVIKLNGSGSVIKVPQYAVLNLYDCDTTTKHYFTEDATTGLWTIAENQASPTDPYVIGGCITGGSNTDGGGVYIDGNASSKGIFNMFSGTIAGNKATNCGGGVYVHGTFNMQGGVIEYNRAEHTVGSKYFGGGGIAIHENGTGALSGGVIQYNSSTVRGGGVLILKSGDHSRDVSIAGVSIMNNTAETGGGGVYYDDDKVTVILGGDTKIEDNLSGGFINNFQFSEEGRGTTITIGTKTQTEDGNGVLAPTDDMSIGVTLENGTGKFTNDGVGDYSSCFSSDNGNYKVSYNTETAGNEYLELKAITIADILPPDFPSSSSSTVPDNAWFCGNNKLFLLDSSIYVTGTASVSLGVKTNKVVKNGNTYIYDPEYGATLTFNMSEGNNPVLQSITITEDEIFNGTYDRPHVHSIKETNDKVDATHEKPGHKAYYKCDCGACFSDEDLTQEIVNLQTWLLEGGDGYIPPLPPTPVYYDDTVTVTVPVTGDENTVKVSATLSGSTATVKRIKDADLEKVTEGESVTIDLSGAGKNIDTAKIPTETVEKISEKSSLTVKLPIAAVEFDKTATEEIIDQAKGSNIELVVDDIKEVSLNAVQKEAVKKLDTAIIIDVHLASNGKKLCTEDLNGFNGGSAKVILPYEIKNNRTAENYSVFYVSEEGRLEKLSAVYDKELKAFVFEIEHLSNYVLAYDEYVMPFVDVPHDEYYDAIKWAAKNAVTDGVDPTHFNPDGITNRAQMVTFLWKAAGRPESTITECPFEDVKEGSYYYKAVLWATENGITKGTSETTFSPDVNVTRAQAVTLIARMAGVKDDAIGYTHNYIDVLPNVYYSNAAAWAYGNSITEETEDGLFYPDDDCSRKKVLALLYRYFAK